MNDLIIGGSDKLPSITMDAKAGLIEISGRSIPEDGKEFYDSVLLWLQRYSENPRDYTKFIFKLEYINSSSQFSLQHIFKAAEKLHEKYKTEVDWHYEEDDPDMRDLGSDYKNNFSFPINLIPVKEF